MHSEIHFNQIAHNKISKKYEKLHTEIYNYTEQTRLRNALNLAVNCIKSNNKAYTALDVGCGAGNLTTHLIDLGVEVTASDISKDFLKLVETKHSCVKTHILNGEDLSEIADSTYDMVVTYSVLHHIPDYLKMMTEMCRVLKPGGVLYIDHEKNENFWNQVPILMEFYKKQRYSNIPVKIIRKLKNYCNPNWYVIQYKRLNNPRYQEEGDIHVWPDDHIEWEKLKTTAHDNDVIVVKEFDFLLFDSKYKKSLYDKYCNKISDMKTVIFRKKFR
ncbi:MAG: class I SAM-dependent methyltransferase [Candidatus Paceibacteria bacterium]